MTIHFRPSSDLSGTPDVIKRHLAMRQQLIEATRRVIPPIHGTPDTPAKPSPFAARIAAPTPWALVH